VYRADRLDGAYLRLEGGEDTPFTTGRTAYVDSNLVGGRVYFYRVSAVTAAEEKGLSEFAGAAALPDTLAEAGLP